MADTPMTTIGTLLLSSVLPPIVEKATSLLLDQAVDQYDIMVHIQRDIRSLKTKLNEIKGILEEAEKKQIDNNNVRELLRELIDVGYDARDVLDDFMTAASINTNMNITAASIDARRTSRWVMFDCFPFSFFLRCFGINVSSSSIDLQVEIPFLIRFQLANRIKSVQKRLGEIMEQSDIVNIRDIDKKKKKSDSPPQRPLTMSSENKQRNLFFGRKDEKDEIIEKLEHHNGNDVVVVPIWGVGGVGKTTLAKSIYNDEKVKVEDYPISNRHWEFVGEKKFSAKEVIKKMITDELGNDDFQRIHDKLGKKFNDSRFLIVLDDVWYIDSNEWSLLLNPLTNAGKGGVIIITTRKSDVFTATSTPLPKNLGPLSYEDCWLIFESYAFADGKSDTRPDLKRIGRKIVEKLNGLPLAAKVVGRSLMNTPYARTWRNCLEIQEWKLKSNVDDIMPALKWSYNCLSQHVKPCFAYCSLFPKGHVFYEKVLVEMWMAHDLIQNAGGADQRRPEDVGAEYFRKLVHASLLQSVDGKYVMHDMIHDLALHVSNEEFVTVNSELSTDIMRKARHITIIHDDDYSKRLSLCKSKRLLTLYTVKKRVFEEYTTCSHNDMVRDVFKHLKSIRVLVLVSKKISDIPDSISELRHLRYLDVSGTAVKSLPDSTCLLCNLQMLAAPLDAELPRDIVNITNLRYIRANLSTCKGVSKLTSLQELFSINVCGGDNIGELGDMQQLCGKLTIKGLENVTCLDAPRAFMMEKVFIDQLKLVFSTDLGDATNISAQELLDSLECPPYLKYLNIVGYNSLEFPSWMVDGTRIANLRTLELSECHQLESLPPLGEMRSLKHLYLVSMDKVERLGDEFYGKGFKGNEFFPSLELLHLNGMKKWKGWDAITSKDSTTNASFFPCLTKLTISNCPILVSVIPSATETCISVMKSLKHLEIQKCSELGDLTSAICFPTKIECLHISLCERMTKIEVGSLPSLSCLMVRGCVELISISGVVGVNRLSVRNCQKLDSLSSNIIREVEDLRISNCPLLELKCEDGSSSSSSSSSSWSKLLRLNIDNEPIFRNIFEQDLVYIRYMTITKNIKILKYIGELTENSCDKLKFLTHLFISDCKEIESLPIGGLPLQSLGICNCPRLQSLPARRLPPTLKRLEISACPLLYERCKDEFGPDWHKIKHIDERYIRPTCTLVKET